MRCLRSTRPLLLALLLASVALPMYAGPHRPSHTLREHIALLEQDWKQAALSNDIDAMDHLLSDDFLGITANGQVVTKPQQLDRMRAHTFMLKSVSVSDMKIKLIGQRAAIVTSLAQVEGSNDGHPLNGYFRYTRVYQRLPGTTTWEITSFEATRVHNHLLQAEGPGVQE